MKIEDLLRNRLGVATPKTLAPIHRCPSHPLTHESRAIRFALNKFNR